MFIILCAIGAAVLWTLGFISVFLSLGVILIFYKYAYSVLDDTAHGHLKARPQIGDSMSGNIELPLKQIVIIIILAYLNFKVYRTFGDVAFFFSAALSYFLFPASVMVLAVEHSLPRAINPVLLFSFIYRVGWPYVILWFFLFVLSTGMEVTSGFLYEWLGSVMFSLASLLITFYFVLVMFHMMGYVIYQHHESLGLTIEENETVESFHKRHNSEVSEGPAGLAPVEVLIKEGKFPEAKDMLLSLKRDYPLEKAVWHKLFRLLVMLDDAAEMESAASEYIERQFSENNLREAAVCYLEAIKVAKNFRPKQAEQRFELAKYFSEGGEPAATVAVLNNLHVDFPSFEKIPEAYLMVAKILSERFNQDSKAKDILGFILKKYPQSSVNEEATEYQKMLQNMA